MTGLSAKVGQDTRMLLNGKHRLSLKGFFDAGSAANASLPLAASSVERNSKHGVGTDGR